jgi:ribosomal protein L37AE/L43A
MGAMLADMEQEQSCPQCGAPIRHRPVLSVRCRKCGHRWSRVLSGGVAFELQYTEGDEVVGPIGRARIREMLYAGELTGRERVRLPGSESGWRAVAACEEFSEVLELLEIQAPRDSRIQGWQSHAPPKTPPKPMPIAAPVAPARVPEKPASRPIVLLVLMIILLIAVLFYFMLQW